MQAKHKHTLKALFRVSETFLETSMSARLSTVFQWRLQIWPSDSIIILELTHKIFGRLVKKRTGLRLRRLRRVQWGRSRAGRPRGWRSRAVRAKCRRNRPAACPLARLFLTGYPETKNEHWVHEKNIYIRTYRHTYIRAYVRAYINYLSTCSNIYCRRRRRMNRIHFHSQMQCAIRFHDLKTTTRWVAWWSIRYSVKNGFLKRKFIMFSHGQKGLTYFNVVCWTQYIS